MCVCVILADIFLILVDAVQILRVNFMMDSRLLGAASSGY
jgi:hypothetical protein